MGDVEQGGIAHESGDDGCLDDLEVGHVDIFGDDEGRRAHDRRHELAIGAGRYFGCGGLARGIADLLHERDRKGAGGDDIGDARSRDHSHQTARSYRRLGRPAPEPSQQGQGQVDEEPAGTGFFEQGSQQDEEIDDRGRNPQGNAVDALGRERDLGDELSQRDALEGQHFGHPGAEEGIEGEEGDDDRQGRPHHPAGRFEQDQGDRHPHNKVQPRGEPRTQGDPFPVEHDVEGADRTRSGQQPVESRHPFDRRED